MFGAQPVNEGVERVSVVVNCRVCCVCASDCFACSHPVCVCLHVLSDYCSANRPWKQCSETPSGGDHCFPDILHQIVSSAGENVAGVRTSALLHVVIDIKACRAAGSNDFLSL